jgi:signal transduction histidine kinase
MEMKKVLEVFPNAVLIQAVDNAKNKNSDLSFRNHQFEVQIMDIKKRTRELDNINLSFEQTDSLENIKSVTCDLNTYLYEIHKRLKDNEVFEQKKIVLKSKRLPSDTITGTFGSDDQSKDKFFTIKTMKVEWEGQKSYMDVFIDNTDIVRLEEANNSIKCQKIMFASASHEFRTPLNAIMNSYRFIEDHFNNVETCLGRINSISN